MLTKSDSGPLDSAPFVIRPLPMRTQPNPLGEPSMSSVGSDSYLGSSVARRNRLG
jgi:hypothetical protein